MFSRNSTRALLNIRKKQDEEEQKRRVPILEQLQSMLTHTVQPGDTLWGMAQKHLQKGERWPEIRDLNISTLEEGLSRFAPDDPRRQKELGHWIFPGQEFKLPLEAPPPVSEGLPVEPPKEPSGGLLEALQRRLKGYDLLPEAPEAPKKATPEGTVSLGDWISDRLGRKPSEPLKIPTTPPPEGVVPIKDAIRDSYKGWAEKQTAKPAKQDYNVDDLVKSYLEWNFERQGKTPTEKDVEVALRKVTKHPEIYQKGFANEVPKTAIGKVGNFMSRMSEAGAGAFTLTQSDMPLATTGSAAADMVAETAGSLMGLLSPGGPVDAIFSYARQVLWGIAPKLAKMLKAPVDLVYRTITASGGMATLGAYGADTIAETPKEAGKGAVVGAFMGAAEHVAGPVTNAITRKLGIPVHHSAEKIIEAINTQGVGMSTLSAGYAVLEGKSAKEVAGDALAGYVLGLLLGGASVAYSQAETRIVVDRHKTMRVEDFMKMVDAKGLTSLRDAKGRHTGRWVTADGEHVIDMRLTYKGKSYELTDLVDRPLINKIMTLDFAELPRGVEPEIWHTEQRLGVKGAAAQADFYVHPEHGTMGTKPDAQGGATRRRPQGKPEILGIPAPREGEGVVTVGPKGEADVVRKLPPVAYDLVVRTKNAQKKEYGRALIDWLEGKTDKPTVPEGLSAGEAKDIETKLTKIAEREGIVPETTPEKAELEPAPTETPSKEPWQMTKDELAKNMEGYGEDVGAWEQDKPWTGELPPVGTWRMDPNTGALEQLRLMDVNEITPMEPEDEVRGRDDYKQYVEWAKQGIQPPPITVVRGIEDGNWLSIDRRRLMAAKESGQKTILAWVSDTDMETAMPTPTHKSAVEQALKEGKPVPPEVLADYPDLTPKEAAPAKTEKPPAEETVRVYKGWVPYDFRDPAKPMIERVERQSEFPSFTKKDAGIKVAGFFTTDIPVAKHFAKVISKDGVVGTFDLTIGRALEIDAKGERAGNVQFEDQGKPFRDAARSGEYDTIIIRNTSDEGDVYVALSPDNIKIVSHDSIVDAEGNLIADEPPAKTEKPPAEKKVVPATEEKVVEPTPEPDMMEDMKRMGVGEFYGDLYATDKTDVDGLAKKYPQLFVRVKDVNGNRRTLTIAEFAELSKIKAFTDRMREASIYLEDPGRENHANFMSGLLEQNKQISSGSKVSRESVSIKGIQLINNSTISMTQQAKYVDAITDDVVRKALVDNGIKSVIIEPPHVFGLSEQGNIDIKNRTIYINSDAIDPRNTILHEVGHKVYAEMSAEQKAKWGEILEEIDNKAIGSYKRLGKPDEAFSETYAHKGEPWADEALARVAKEKKEALSGKKEVAADEADVKRKRDAGPPESFTGLDRRLSVKPAKEGAYKQFIVARGGIPGDSEGGPGNDPALSEILRPHQIDGVNLAVSAIDKYGGFVLADGTGAGKTMQILATMNHYAKQGHTALIVVPNRTIINDAYKRDGKMLGLDFNVVKGSSLEKGKLNITTYASLNKIHASNPEYIAFDEAHSLKNVSSNRSQIGRRLASRAKGVLFASATPFDKGEHLPYLEKTGIFSRKSHDEIMVGLGYKKDTMTVRTKYGDKQITVWKPNVSILERARRMDALFEEISDLGLMVKREVSMDRVAVGYWGIKLPKDAHAKLVDVEDFYLSKYEVGDADHLPPMAKAQMLMAQRRFQEHYKKEDAYKLAMSEVNAGRPVVIFATRVSPSHLKEQTYMELGGERILVDEIIVDTSPPTLPDLAEMFEKAGVKCSKIYGSGNVDREVKKFQDGKTQIALATPEKGGAGLSLDDTVGDAPRTMIVVTPLFSGVDNVQLPGRINRMSTKSPSRVVYMIADTAIDEWNKGIITEKMKTLNAVVRGDISKLDLDDMDRDVGAEALPEPEKQPEPERIGRDVAFTKDETYGGIKQFEATIRLQDDTAELIIRQSSKGANTWNIYHEYYSGGTGETKKDLLAQGLSRKDAKVKAKELLLNAVDVAPGGEITFGAVAGEVEATPVGEPAEGERKDTRPVGEIAGYTESTIMDTKTAEDIAIRREYRIVENDEAEKPYQVQQRIVKAGEEGEWKQVSAFGELKDANEYVAGVDDIVAVAPDVAGLIKTEAPKEKVEPLKPFKPIEKGNKDSAFTDPDDTEIHFEYCLSEADDIVTSFTGIDVIKPNPAYYQDEPGLQPRDIKRKATEHRINHFVKRLNPRRLGENTEIAKGAPTVGPDGRVEIGNHRAWALITAYKKGLPLGTKYREWLTKNAAKFGLSREAVEGTKEPILVRLRLTEIDRATLAKKGNVSGEQKMSAAEIAELDAAEMNDSLLSTFVPHEDGRLETKDNKPFIGNFIQHVVPSSERNDMIAGDGSGLTLDGEKRIRNAILAKVYGNTNALIKLMEETTPNVKNIMNAMNIIAPRLLLQKHEMEKGNLFPLDLSENLSRAMVKLSELRDSKMTVEDYFTARQLFGIELTNLEKDILAILDENKYSAKRVGLIFKEYMDGVDTLGHPKQISIVSKTPPTRAELLQTSAAKAKERWELTKSEERERAGQATLFENKTVDGERDTEADREGGEGAGGKEASRGAEGGTQKSVGPAPKLKTAPPSQSIPLTRRRDIVKFLSDKLDIPIRVGRYRQRARGIFKVRPEVVRTKLAQDIPIIAHEVGHYLDKRLDLSSTKAYDDELMALGQVTSKPSYSKKQVRAEGVAEFMRLYLTDPQDAIRQAPHYYAAFEQIMAANQDIHDVLLQARQDITNWISQPAKARVLGVLSIGEKPARKMTLGRLYTAAVDELHPIKKYVDALFPEGVDFDKDPFKKAWLSRGWAGKAETLLNYGIVDKDYKKIGPSLKEILAPVKQNLDDFRAYVTAKRAIELHDRNIEPGITREDAEQVVGDLETPEFAKAQRQLVEFSDALVDILVDAQILDRAGADTFRAMNRNYVPFYRVFEEMGGTHGYGKTGYANVGNPVRRMKGSQRDIVDPLESIIRNTFFFTNVAERNDVGRLVVELAERKQGSGKWVEKVPASMRPVTFGLSEIREALEGIGVDVEGLDLGNAATIFRPSPFPAGKENILAVWQEGKKGFYQVEPELYRALLSLDKESANLFINLLSKPAALLRAGATLSPDFMVRNPIRDMWTALVYSKYGYKPADFIKGLFSVLKKDDLYWKFHASGAAHGAMVSLDRDYLQGSLRGMLQTSAKEKAKFLLTHPVEVLRALSEYGEMATRLGEFGRGVKAEGKKGKGIRQAALSARDVTLDFARWGNVGKIPNRVIAFFNANVQGMDKMARAFRQKPGQSILRCLLYITLPSIILYMMNRDDERYQELPQWEKDLFWIVLTPKHVFRIPKPFELGVIFGTLPERVLDYIYTEDPEAFKGYLNTAKEAGLPDILPTALTGWLEAFYANKSFFTDRPIVPVGEERLPAEMQYGNYTSETAKLIGRYLHISPRKADHIAYSYGGGLARYGTKVLDQLLEAVGATEQVTKPASTLADYPVVGAFTSRVWSNSKSMDTLYTRMDEAEKAYSKRKAGRDLTAKEQERLSNLGRYRSAASDMSELRLAGQRVFDDPKMTAEEKQEKMDTINILRINIARRAIGLDPITVKP